MAKDSTQNYTTEESKTFLSSSCQENCEKEAVLVRGTLVAVSKGHR